MTSVATQGTRINFLMRTSEKSYKTFALVLYPQNKDGSDIVQIKLLKVLPRYKNPLSSCCQDLIWVITL